jgi:hypothetical protein
MLIALTYGLVAIISQLFECGSCLIERRKGVPRELSSRRVGAKKETDAHEPGASVCVFLLQHFKRLREIVAGRSGSAHKSDRANSGRPQDREILCRFKLPRSPRLRRFVMKVELSDT